MSRYTVDAEEKSGIRNVNRIFDLLHLPESVLLKIMSYMSLPSMMHLSATCKYLRWLSFDRMLWMNYDFVVQGDDCVESMESFLPLIPSATLKSITWDIDNMYLHHLFDLLDRNPKLKKLTVTDPNLKLNEALLLLDKCKHLLELSFLDAVLLPGDILDGIASLQKLVYLELPSCHLITSIEFRNFLDKLSPQTLQHINLNRAYQIDDKALVKLLTLQNKSLKYLSFDGRKNTDEMLLSLKTCKYIESLYILTCGQFSVTALNVFVKLPKLKRFCGGECDNFSKVAWINFLSGHRCKYLEYFNIRCSNFDNECALLLARNCPDLVDLTFVGCPLQDEGLEAIVNNCSKLESLEVISISNLFGNSLRDIPRKLPRLRLINMTECYDIANDILQDAVYEMKGRLIAFNSMSVDISYEGEKQRREALNRLQDDL